FDGEPCPDVRLQEPALPTTGIRHPPGPRCQLRCCTIPSLFRLRVSQLAHMNSPSPIHDLLVVGGGINGTGIAVDAAGRGLDVLLCEMGDLGAATSSASTKLIHGGLRYLELYEFRLVREALAEREVLLRKAPHLVQPLRFRLPHQRHLRPRWMIRLGLYLYDFLGERVTLPRSRAVRFADEGPLVPELDRGFEYFDARVDDARLVLLNAMQARDLGA